MPRSTSVAEVIATGRDIEATGLAGARAVSISNTGFLINGGRSVIFP